MPRWTMTLAIGVLLATGGSLFAQEEIDPFADIDSPVSALQTEPVLAPPATPMTPVEMPPIIRRPVPTPESTAAQQRVHERAAEQARQRKALIEQRKQAPPAAIPAFFPTQGPLGLYPIDRGIRVGFRPVTLSGLEPSPSLRPIRPATPKAEPVRKPESIRPPVIQQQPQE